MRILGIDPGTRNMAVAMLKTDTLKIDYHNVFCWDKNYQKAFNALKELTSQVEVVAIEKQFFTGVTLRNNITTLELIGIAKLASAYPNHYNKPSLVVEYSPKEIKKEVVGSGNASKEDIINKVKEVFGFTPPTNHEADAIAIAYTYYLKNKNKL